MMVVGVGVRGRGGGGNAALLMIMISVVVVVVVGGFGVGGGLRLASLARTHANTGVDPLAGQELVAADYFTMSTMVRRALGDRVVLGLEGGYSLDTMGLPEAVAATLEAFATVDVAGGDPRPGESPCHADGPAVAARSTDPL